MGHWNTAILSNDNARDIHQDFFELYNEGEDPLKVSARLQKEYGVGYPAGPHDDEWIDILLGFALAQWETKCLDPKLLLRVQTVVSEGLDAEMWRGKGADEKMLQARAAVLSQFLEQIAVERPKPKRRAKSKFKFLEKELVRITSPNGKIEFEVGEVFVNDQYVHTSSMLTFGGGGSGVMHYCAQDMPVSARWIDNTHLEITHAAGIKFDKQDASTYYSGARVFITYIAASTVDE